MQLFWMEVKKIFSKKILLLVAFVNVVLYFLLFKFHIEYFPNGRPAGDAFKIEQQMIIKYGEEMDEGEYQDFVTQYEREVKTADSYLQKDTEAQAIGVTTYEAFRNLDRDNKELNNYSNLVMFERREDLFWELQARESLIEYYDQRNLPLEANIRRESGERQKRYKQLLDEGKYGIFTSTVSSNFREIERNLAIIIFISIAILISPIFLRDTLSSVVSLQYSSKKGRGLYRTKWLAGFISTIILTIVLLAIYLAIYAMNGTFPYFNVPMYAFVDETYWYDLTFVQYIYVSIIAIFVCAILLGMLSMIISTIVPNRIALIGMQIVVLFIMIALVIQYLIVDMISIWNSRWVLPVGYFTFIILAGSLTRLVWKRERYRDVL